MSLGIRSLVLTALLAGQSFAQQSQAPAAVGPLARQLNDAFAGVYEKVAPAVVVIEVRGTSDAAVSGLPEGFEFFFRGNDGKTVPNPLEEGSGFVISSDGYIMTNCHVVESGVEGQISVKLKDGRKLPATVVGIDKKSDIAVIKVDAKDLPVVELGDSDSARVGQFAFAIGAPYELAYTFTVGVISAKGRDDLTPSQTYEEYIQTDAAINPGNSGGPLCDIDGRVIGINTMIHGMNRGLGFAVPSNIAKAVGQQLMANGKMSRPWLGISIIGIEENEEVQRYFPTVSKGVVVQNIDENTPAYGSDLRAGDVILKVDGKAIGRSRDLQREILSKKVGQDVQLELWRDGQISTVSVRTGEQPEKFVRASNRAWPHPAPAPAPSAQPQRKKPSRDGVAPHGLQIQDSAAGGEQGRGVQVGGVEPESAAAAAGLQPGDVITEVAGKPVHSREDFDKILGSVDLSRGVMLLIERNGQKTFSILKP